MGKLKVGTGQTQHNTHETGSSSCVVAIHFAFACAAFYSGLKSKVGLAAAKTAAMRINL